MKINVKLFARARELAGRDEVVIDLPSGSTVTTLRDEVARQVPTMGAFVNRCAVAVDGEYVVDTTEIREGSDVALIPPVSGG